MTMPIKTASIKSAIITMITSAILPTILPTTMPTTMTTLTMQMMFHQLHQTLFLYYRHQHHAHSFDFRPYLYVCTRCVTNRFFIVVVGYESSVYKQNVVIGWPFCIKTWTYCSHKGHHNEYVSQKIKYCPIVFDIDCKNQDANFKYSTPLISSNPTVDNIIMYQLKSFKRNIY